MSPVYCSRFHSGITCAVLLVLLSMPMESLAEDLATVLRSYAESAQTIRASLPKADPERSQSLQHWRQSWLEKIMVASAAGGENYEQGVVACIGLANSLGRPELTRQFCQDLLARSEDNELLLLAHQEILDIDIKDARMTADPAALNDAFSRLEAIETLLDTSKPEHAARRVRNIATRAELHVTAGDAVGAARSFGEAAEYFGTLSTAAQSQARGFDAEYLWYQKIRVDASTGNVEAVDEALRQLGTSAKRQEAGLYAGLAVQFLAQNSPARARRLAGDLIDRDPGGKYVASLKHEIAKSYVQESNFQKAVDVLEELLHSHEEDLLEQDKHHIAAGENGLLSVIYYDLLQSYRQLGMSGKAQDIAARSEILFPKDKAIRGAVGAVRGPQGGGQIADRAGKKSSSMWRTGFVLVNAIFIVGCLSMLMRRKDHRPAQEN